MDENNPFENYHLSSTEMGDLKIWRIHPRRQPVAEVVSLTGRDPLRDLAERTRKAKWSGCVEVISTPDRFFIHGDYDLLNSVSDLGYTADLLVDQDLTDDYLTQKMTFQGPGFAGLPDHLEQEAVRQFGLFRRRLIELKNLPRR